MTIIIFEGPDCSGKTYAIDKIAKHFNSGFVLKNSYKPKTKEDTFKIYRQYWRIMNLLSLMPKSQLVILDRFYPSQAVYSYLREKDEMYSNDIVKLDENCQALKYKLIYLDTPAMILQERYDKIGDENVSKKDLIRLAQRYNLFLAYTTLPVLRLNTLSKDWMKKAEAFINESN